MYVCVVCVCAFHRGQRRCAFLFAELSFGARKCGRNWAPDNDDGRKNENNESSQQTTNWLPVPFDCPIASFFFVLFPRPFRTTGKHEISQPNAL